MLAEGVETSARFLVKIPSGMLAEAAARFEKCYGPTPMVTISRAKSHQWPHSTLENAMAMATVAILPTACLVQS